MFAKFGKLTKTQTGDGSADNTERNECIRFKAKFAMRTAAAATPVEVSEEEDDDDEPVSRSTGFTHVPWISTPPSSTSKAVSNGPPVKSFLQSFILRNVT